MSSRTARSDVNDEGGVRSARVGLSEYTTQRLAELRARRAELDADYSDYKSSTKHRADTATKPATTSTTLTSSATATSTRSDILESYHSKRSLSSTAANSSSQSAKSDHSPADDKTNGKMSPIRSVSYVPPEGSRESKMANGTLSSKGLGLSTGSSFSKADYGSSRATQLDEIKASVRLNRSNSARATPSTEDEDEFVGFASLPEQVHRKAVKRGFDFTLMAVGDSGLGKSTLISSLFLNPELYKDRKLLDAQDRISRTVEIEKKYMEIEEKGVKLRLTIIDTPGYNDSVDAEQSTQPIERYVTQQFEQYFKDESGLNRKNIKDYRVHCCLYFISPYGYGLRQTDIKFIKRLQDKVNIVPVIGKADTLTPSEVTRLKQRILDQIDEHNLQIYEFPECDSDEDEDFKRQDAELKAAIPFAVIGSNTVVEVNGKKVRGRLYPWGVVEVDNPQHCDFSKLRMMLISTHMQDLKDVTRDVHYENFRAKQIKEQMTKSQRERNISSQPEDFYKTNKEKISADSKLKRDSSPNFESIMDQSQLLEQKEEEIRRMQEMIVKMQAQLQNSKRANGAISNGDNNV